MKQILLKKSFFIFLVVLFCSLEGISQTIGDYQSAATGNWTSLTSWQYYNGSAWVTPSGTSPQGYPGQYAGTGAVLIQSGHTITINAAITTFSFGTLTITGALTLTGDNSSGGMDFNLTTQSIIVTPSFGFVEFNNKLNLRLPVNAILQVTTVGLDVASGCSANQIIYIGITAYAKCNGGGSLPDFDDLMAGGGTLNPIATSNSPVCQNNTVNLSGSFAGAVGKTTSGGSTSGVNYSWSIQAPDTSVQTSSLQNYSFAANQTGNYSVTLTCTTYFGSTLYSNSKTITVIVNALPATPTIAVVGSTTFCSGGSVTLTSSTGTSYLWSNNATTQSISPTISGSYTVKVTNAAGCQSASSAATVVTVNPISTIVLTSGTQSPTVCTGTAITNTVYTFGGSATGVSVSGLPSGLSSSVVGSTVTISGTPTSSGTYIITTNGHTAPCTATTISGTVTMNTASTIVLTSGTQSPTVCAGAAITNTVYTFGGSATGVSVSGLPSGLSSSVVGSAVTISGTPTSSGTYTITTNGHTAPCTAATISGTVTVNVLPNNITNGFSATIICVGGNPQLTYDAEDSSFSAPYSITYKNDATLVEYTVTIPSASAYSFTPGGSTPTTNTGYTIVSISNATCTRTNGIINAGANLIVRPIPTATISGTTSVCVGDSSPNISFTNPQTVAITVTYTINGGANQTINIASTSSSNIAVATTAAGAFIYNLVSVVYQTNPNCSNALSSNATVTVNPNLAASVSISASPSGAICTGTSVTFTSTPTNGGTTPAYQWYNGVTPISGATSSNYTSTTLVNADAIKVVMTSNATPCLSGSPATSNAVTMTVNSLPSTPIAATPTNPSCKVPTGSVSLSGLPTSGTIIQTGTKDETYIIAVSDGGIKIITGLHPGNYNFAVSNGNCISGTVSVVIIAPDTNTWSNGSWSNGTPTINQRLVFASNYPNTNDVDIEGCSCQVTGSTSVTIKSERTLKIENGVEVQPNATLTFENNASLVQINDDAVNSGSINYHRHTGYVKRYDFTYWSSPVAGQTLKALSPNTLYDKYYSYNPNTGWVISYNGAAIMEEGKGYIIRASQTFSLTVAAIDTNPVFIGSPNNGVVTLASLAGNKVHLLGNPYPSAIDADEFIALNSNSLEGTLYFWTHNTLPSKDIAGNTIYNYTANDYVTYNKTGGVNFAGKIAAGQGFFAPTSATGGTVVFNNKMRLGAGEVLLDNSQFFRLSNTSKATAKTTLIEKSRVWLNLTNKEGAFKQTLVGYISGATNDYDGGFDGMTYDGNQFVDFYSVNNVVNLSIQGRALPFVKNDSVVLGYRSTIKGEFQISIDHADGALATQNIFLEDKDLKVLHDLKKEPYTFSTEKGAFNTRFVLRYVEKNAIDPVVETVQENQTVFVSVNNNEIGVSATEDVISKIIIYDVSGKILYQKEDVAANNFMVQHLIFSQQVLLVNVVLANGKTISTKIIY